MKADNQILEVEVLLTPQIIEENPEINDVYDSEKKLLKFEIDSLIPKEFSDKLSEIMPEFKGSDIVQFNPLIKAVNSLQEIKILIPDADDFDASERVLIDNNKTIGSFNSSLAKAKKIIKQPHIDFNKKVDDIFKLFEQESLNTKNALEKNFEAIVKKREEIKLEKDNKKKEKELQAISQLTSSNEEMDKKIANQNILAAKAQIESNLSKLITNAVTKIPGLNVEGLNSLLVAIQNTNDSMYISLDNQALITKEELAEYKQTYIDNRAIVYQQIKSAINTIGVQEELEKRKIADSVVAASPNFSQGTFETNQNIVPETPIQNETVAQIPVVQEEIVTKVFQISDLKNDIQKFQHLTNFNNRMLEEYKSGIEELKKIAFEHLDLNKLLAALLDSQYPTMIGYLEKYANYTEKKNELIKNTLK